MDESFQLRLDEIQPSQLYISKTKMAAVMKHFKSSTQSLLDPIPIKKLGGELVSTDGHTRGVVWYLEGHMEVKCVWEDTEMDWDAYRICVDWCKEVDITSIIDLNERFLDHDDYEILWLDRCRIMQEELATQKLVTIQDKEEGDTEE